MPKIKSAKKALRQARKKTIANKTKVKKTKDIIKSYKKHPDKEGLKKVYSFLDKLAKKNIFHKNKVNRLKSKLASLLSPEKAKKEQKTPQKSPTIKKTAPRKKISGAKMASKK